MPRTRVLCGLMFSNWSNPLRLSVVVPCYNEALVLDELVERLSAITTPYGDQAEIILVDDGSTDDTWESIRRANTRIPQVRGLRLSTNRGHQYALTAGLEAARGERIFMLDADLQDPPELLNDMMAMLDRGYDVVYGRRRIRTGESTFKRVSAFVFYRVLNSLSDTPIPNDAGDFRLVNRRALDAVLAMTERTRFIRGMFAWVGFNQIGLEYDRAPRAAGETKYPLGAMLRFAVDAVTGFSTMPLKIATRLAILTLGVSVLVALYVFVSLIFYNTVSGWASMLLAISFFSGIQLATLGIMGEYVGRLYTEAKGRPLYILSDEIGTSEDFDDKDSLR